MECPCGRGEGQAVLNGGIEGVGSMDLQARAGALIVACNGHVDLTVVRADAPQARGRVVAEQSAGSQNRRQLEPSTALVQGRPGRRPGRPARATRAGPGAKPPTACSPPRPVARRSRSRAGAARARRSPHRQRAYPPTRAARRASGDFVAHSAPSAPFTRRRAVDGDETHAPARPIEPERGRSHPLNAAVKTKAAHLRSRQRQPQNTFTSSQSAAKNATKNGVIAHISGCTTRTFPTAAMTTT